MSLWLVLRHSRLELGHYGPGCLFQIFQCKNNIIFTIESNVILTIQITRLFNLLLEQNPVLSCSGKVLLLQVPNAYSLRMLPILILFLAAQGSPKSSSKIPQPWDYWIIVLFFLWLSLALWHGMLISHDMSQVL